MGEETEGLSFLPGKLYFQGFEECCFKPYVVCFLNVLNCLCKCLLSSVRAILGPVAKAVPSSCSRLTPLFLFDLAVFGTWQLFSALFLK